MSYAETVERLRKIRKGPGSDPTKPTKAPSVGSVSPGGGPSPDFSGEPAAPCTACGGNSFYRLDPAGPWHCHGCHPPERGPVSLLSVPGGHVPGGQAQDVDTVVREAVDGLELSADDVRRSLTPEDLVDVKEGRIGARELRAFALYLIDLMADDGGSAA